MESAINYAEVDPQSSVVNNVSTSPCDDCKELRQAERAAEPEFTFVTLELRVPKKSTGIVTLVRDFMGVASDKDAEFLALRITENRW